MRFLNGVTATTLTRFLQDDSGQDLIEYALAAALIGLAAVSSMKTLANVIGNTFSAVGNTLTSAV